MVTVSTTDLIDEPASVRTRSNGEAEVNPCQRVRLDTH
jgi:hypothetical protein